MPRAEATSDLDVRVLALGFTLGHFAVHPCRLYVRGQILGYKRSKVNQYEHTSLIRLENVSAKEDTSYYLVCGILLFLSGLHM